MGMEMTLNLKEEHRLRVFENRVLRRIFGPEREREREEATGERRKLHSEELYNYSPNINRVTKSRRMRWSGHAARMGKMRNAYKILVGRSE
jgi:hypothetical protein